MQAEARRAPGELGLARLMREVETKAQAPAAANSRGAPTGRPRPRPWLWQAVAALALAVMLGQGVLLWPGAERPDQGLAGGEALLAALRAAPIVERGDHAQ